VIRLAWPVLVAQLAVIASGVLDTVMGGRYSAVDLAAVGIGQASISASSIGLMGVITGALAIAAQLFGEAAREDRRGNAPDGLARARAGALESCC